MRCKRKTYFNNCIVDRAFQNIGSNFASESSPKRFEISTFTIPFNFCATARSRGLVFPASGLNPTVSTKITSSNILAISFSVSPQIFSTAAREVSFVLIVERKRK